MRLPSTAIALLLAAFAAAPAAPAAAQTLREQVGAWKIMDGALGPGCFVYNLEPVDRNVFALVYNPNDRNFRVTLDANAAELVAGRRYDIVARFDGGAMPLAMTAVSNGGRTMLQWEGRDWKALLDALATGARLEILLGGRAIARFALAGGDRAIEALASCRRAYVPAATDAPPHRPQSSPSPPPRSRKADPFGD